MRVEKVSYICIGLKLDKMELFEDVILYADEHLGTEYMSFLSSFNVEVKDDKARVECISMFGTSKTRLNNMFVYLTTNEFKYIRLVVNGKKVYFKLPRK